MVQIPAKVTPVLADRIKFPENVQPAGCRGKVQSDNDPGSPDERRHTFKDVMIIDASMHIVEPADILPLILQNCNSRTAIPVWKSCTVAI